MQRSPRLQGAGRPYGDAERQVNQPERSCQICIRHQPSEAAVWETMQLPCPRLRRDCCRRWCQGRGQLPRVRETAKSLRRVLPSRCCHPSPLVYAVPRASPSASGKATPAQAQAQAQAAVRTSSARSVLQGRYRSSARVGAELVLP